MLVVFIGKFVFYLIMHGGIVEVGFTGVVFFAGLADGVVVGVELYVGVGWHYFFVVAVGEKEV